VPDTGVPTGARITVVFPTYRAADAVAGLVEGIVAQRPPVGADPAGWLEVVFIDNASPDDTVERLERELERQRPPFPVRVIRNEENLGLARSFNRALSTVVTDYVLTCHADCRFGSDDYVARVVGLLDAHPDVAVVSGQSVADVDAGLSRVEKVYLAGNLMDVLPGGDGELASVGFAEGRCDGFRMGALRRAGLYDTTLRRAGEDQILSARMRADGFRVCRAPGLRYFLSVSSDQDSLLKLVRHAQLFGRVTPYLLLANRGTMTGIVGSSAGRNRNLRTSLRVLQLVGAGGWLALGAAVATRRSPLPAAAVVAATTLAKGALFRRHVAHLQFDPGDVVALVALQPALDIAYATGLAMGMAQLACRGEGTIS
jgi:glycosyltransferase involved in cell wall biosynthesis